MKKVITITIMTMALLSAITYAETNSQNELKSKLITGLHTKSVSSHSVLPKLIYGGEDIAKPTVAVVDSFSKPDQATVAIG